MDMKNELKTPFKKDIYVSYASEFYFQWGNRFSLSYNIQTDYGAYPVSYPMGTWGSSPVGKVTGT
jgi:hypothetical protein